MVAAWHWDSVFEITCSTLIDVPPATQAAYSFAKDETIQMCLYADRQNPAHWRKLSMFDTLVLNNRRPEGESQAQSVVRRLQQAADGDWSNLWLEATAPRPINRDQSSRDTKDLIALVHDLIRAEETGRALKAIKQNTPPMRDAARYAEVLALFPETGVPSEQLRHGISYQWTSEETDELAKVIARSLRRPPRRTRPGILGGRLEHWSILKAVDGGLARAGALLARFGLGSVPDEVITAHARCEVLAAEKTTGGLRPLQMGSVCRRIAMSGVCRLLRGEVQSAAGDDQLATGVSDGCPKVYHAARTMCVQTIERGIFARDIAGAHQNLDRKYAAREIESRCPRLLQPFLTWYGRQSTHVWRTAANEIKPVPSSTGVDQGDPLANSVFCVSMAAPAEALKQDLQPHDPTAAVFQFSDDVQVVTKTNLFAVVEESTARHWSKTGLKFKPSKDACWSLDPAPLADPLWQAKRVERLRCLGPELSKPDEDSFAAPIAPEFEAQQSGNDLSAAKQKVSDLAGRLKDLNASGLQLQLCQSLFRVGSSGLIQHIIGTKRLPQGSIVAYDANLRQAWQGLLGIPVTDRAWTRGCLPLRLGGMSFGAIGPRAPAAFIATWSRTLSFVTGHLRVALPSDILTIDSSLAADLRDAAGSLRPYVPPLFSIPWENGEMPTKECRQGTLLEKVYETTRLNVLREMPSDISAAHFRSCGGPGAGGFLIAPSDDSVWMDDLHFKTSVTQRLGGHLRPASDAAQNRCHHRGAAGVCLSLLDGEGIHAKTCPVGGHVIARHDRAVRWLYRWLSQGRLNSEPRLEQVLPEESGRLDLVFQDSGTTVWVDLAVTAAATTSARTTAANARKDGGAARAEEAVKRSRYHSRATPFVLESGGRAGASALSFVRRFSRVAGEGYSTSPAHAWVCLSSAVQIGNAAIELASVGSGASPNGQITFWIP